MFYFLIYLATEIFLLIQFVDSFGGWGFVIELFLSAFVGFMLLARFQASLIRNTRAFFANELDQKEMGSLGIMSMLGAILLIMPGILTDLIGLLLQFNLFGSMAINRSNVKYKKNQKEEDSDVIDVEVVSDNRYIS